MTDKPKITDFNEAKKRVAQKTDKRSGATSGNGKAKGMDGYEKALRKQKGFAGSFGGSGGIRWHHYLQLVLFLVLVAWFMKSCQI